MTSKKTNKPDLKKSRTARNQAEHQSASKWQIAVIGTLLLVLLFLLIRIFTAGSSKTPDGIQFPSDIATETASSSNESDSSTDSAKEESESEDTSSDEEATNEEEEVEDGEEIATEETEPSDGNVEIAYTGDWDPVETNQEGEHSTTDFSKGSADRTELKRAASEATGIGEDNMIEWWVGNNGPNKVISTVSDKEETKTFRVYSEWVDGQGWKPVKVEELKTNDRKNR